MSVLGILFIGWANLNSALGKPFTFDKRLPECAA